MDYFGKDQQKDAKREVDIMSNTVMIKGNKSGIILVLDKEPEFASLKKDIGEKIKETAKFFGNASMAISFEGRELSTQEQREVLEIIEENSQLKIACVVNNDAKQEEVFQKGLQQSMMDMGANSGQFYKGNLRSGQVLEVENSVVVIGDVNIGAKVVSKGNIIVIGNLKGNAFAGAGGNKDAFVLALGMQPIQIRIADFIARAPDHVEKGGLAKKNGLFGMKKKTAVEPVTMGQEIKIAFVEGDNIYIEPLSKDVLNEINI